MSIPRPALAAPLLLAAGLVGGLLLQRGGAVPGPPAPALGPAELDLAAARRFSEGFQEVARRVAPAVVSVIGYELAPGGGRVRQGSGVILGSDGICVTNNHVVQGTDELRVRLLDGRELQARVLGTDPATDLAVLRIQRAGGLVAAPLEAERRPQIGEWVLAVGNPHGYSHTITAGIISALGRTGLDIALYEDFLQTDAAINPGNSGGPLVDLNGRVIGINTAIGSPGSEAFGLGFAIPGHLVRTVLDGILHEGRVRRGWLGVRMGQLDAAAARRLGFERPGLVRVEQVLEDTPAERGGLRPGDVILSMDGVELSSSQELLNRIAAVHPGTTVELELLRDGKRRLTVTVRLEEREPEPDPEIR